jgi:negative regulator of sigma E activity
VSVFIEEGDEGESGYVATSGMGGINAYRHLLKGFLATVVGEVPPVTVKQIAESIMPAEEQ